MERRKFFFKTLVTNFLRLLQERTKKKDEEKFISIDRRAGIVEEGSHFGRRLPIFKRLLE